MDFAVPREVTEQVGGVELVATVNRVEVARRKYPKHGRFLLACTVPPEALQKRPAEVAFAVDKSITDPVNGRELGLIAVSVGLKEYEQTAEFREIQMRASHEAYENVLRKRNLLLPLDRQRELMKLFHELPVWESLRFLNVRIIQSPLDLWMMQQILYEVQPDFVVETGTWYGGSALYWAHTLNGMGRGNARVLTVDVQDMMREGASAHPLWKKYVEFFHGSSTDPAIVAEIAQRVKNWRTVVTLDSDHSMQHVLQELRMYSPMVTPGSYLVVQDTHLDGVPTHPEQGAGPTAAVRRFLAEGGSKEFEQDFSREALVMTFHPGGWLRRKVKR
jgi:cephalosporin hydroxylase